MIDVTQKKLTINEWGACSTGGPFDAPELCVLYIVGSYWCEERKKKRYIETSPVVEAEGRFVKTRSGSVYELGEPSPDFLTFLEELGKPFDPEQPIKVRS